MPEFETEHICKCGAKLKVRFLAPESPSATPDLIPGYDLHKCGLAEKTSLVGPPTVIHEWLEESWRQIYKA
jgi:hypothetical protein